ncbi:MAG: hypothetical protein ABIP94_02930 [Planctomycetota bacterium]
MGGLSVFGLADAWRFRNGNWSQVAGLTFNTPSMFVSAATDESRDTVVAVDAVSSLPGTSFGSSFTQFGCGCTTTMTGISDDEHRRELHDAGQRPYQCVPVRVDATSVFQTACDSYVHERFRLPE